MIRFGEGGCGGWSENVCFLSQGSQIVTRNDIALEGVYLDSVRCNTGRKAPEIGRAHV